MFSITGQFHRVVTVDHRELFNHHQRRMHQWVREYGRPGVAVFALHAEGGLAGHLWLEATQKVRAGTIGRHGKVDLFLRDDAQLSLRHLLLLVRRESGVLDLRVADLATPTGFQAEGATEGEALRAVAANGTVVLRAAGYSLVAIPTGEAPPWNPDAEDPWATLPRRAFVAAHERGELPPPKRREIGDNIRSRDTSISSVAGPAEYGPEPAIEPGEAPRGHLYLTNGGNEERLTVGARALERGLILGRYSRCTGETGAMSDDVSRVHAVLMTVDDEVHIIDAGSTNGVTLGKHRKGKPLKCAPVQPGATYRLGRMSMRWE